jgi:hypothetical protein
MFVTRLLAVTLAALPLAATAGAQSQEMRFREMDRNNDGVITRAEWRGSERAFRANDWNVDGILSGDEVRPGAVRNDTTAQDRPLWDDREDTFQNLDVNRNDRLERREWQGSADAFQSLDRNRDGVLSRGEVVNAAPDGTRASQRGGQNRRNRQLPTAAPATNAECVANPARVVDDIYQQVLERSADEASAGMTQALASGRMTVRDIVAQAAKSPEHGEQFFWKPAVSALYQRLLGRDADPEGLQSFTQLARRDGLRAVDRAIVNSPEFTQRGKPVATVNHYEPEYQAGVRSLYRHVLGRDPDPAGLLDLTRIAEGQGFNAVVDRMVASPEYMQLFGTDVVPGRSVRYCPSAQ